MKKISAIVLTGNKEDLLKGCLQSLSWVDEAILVDTRGKEGKSAYDFSMWRNQGARKAKGEWLLYVDTDERITKKLKEEILLVINKPKKHLGGEILKHLRGGGINGYYIPRKNFFWGKEFKTTWPDYQLRLVKKDKLIKWEGNIHETPKIRGKIDYLKNPLIHLAHRNIDECLENTLKWSRLEAENRFKAGHPKMTSPRFLRIILTGFWQQFIQKKIWREGTEGVIEGIYQIFSLFITYVRLWELQRAKK